MSYERKITEEQARNATDKLQNHMHIMEANKLVSGAHIAVLEDILVEAGLTTKKEFEDRTIDTAYFIMQKMGLI